MAKFHIFLGFCLLETWTCWMGGNLEKKPKFGKQHVTSHKVKMT